MAPPQLALPTARASKPPRRDIAIPAEHHATTRLDDSPRELSFELLHLHERGRAGSVRLCVSLGPATCQGSAQLQLEIAGQLRPPVRRGRIVIDGRAVVAKAEGAIGVDVPLGAPHGQPAMLRVLLYDDRSVTALDADVEHDPFALVVGQGQSCIDRADARRPERHPRVVLCARRRVYKQGDRVATGHFVCARG